MGNSGLVENKFEKKRVCEKHIQGEKRRNSRTDVIFFRVTKRNKELQTETERFLKEERQRTKKRKREREREREKVVRISGECGTHPWRLFVQ